MLKLFRQRQLLVKWLLWGIVLVVGFMMVITLVPGIGGGIDSADPYALVAQVGREQITRQEVLRRLEQWQAQQGQANPFFRRFVAEQLIDELIFQRALEQEAHQLGLQVTPEEVSAQIRRIPELNPQGKFVGQAEYRRLLQQQRLTVGEFEDEVRAGRLVGKLYQLLTDGLRVTDAEIEQEFRARNEKVAVEYVLFKPRALEAEIQPTQEELQAYFKAQAGSYSLPERCRVRYVLVDFDWARQQFPPGREELEGYYQRNLESYRLAEQVRFRHILFRFPDGADEKKKEEVRAQARSLRAELAKGKDFAELAKKHSGDTATAEKGGEVGWVARGQVVPALETVLFSLKKDALSEPVEAGYGIHIVRVMEHQQARLKPFEEVRKEIEGVVAEQKSQQDALRVAQRIVQEVRGTPGQAGSPAGRSGPASGGAGKTLAAAAAAVGLRVVESPLFAKTDSLPGFAGTTSLQEAAFRLKPEEVSEPVSAPPGYVVLQLLEQKAAGPAKFEDVREQVERNLRQERAAERARQRAQALSDAASKSQDLRAAARAVRMEVTLSALFTRDGSVPDLGPVREFAGTVFPLPVGRVAGPLRVGTNWAVLRVAARQEADLKGLERERALLTAQLLQQKRQVSFELYRESLKKRLIESRQLRINQPAITRILGTG